MSIEKSIGEAVGAARKAARMSQADLANAMSESAGWHQTTVSRIEAGSRPLLHSEALKLSEIIPFATGSGVDQSTEYYRVALNHVRSIITKEIETIE